jgi:DhnA family fructose-bisphosphate aldolase class Ia
VLDKLRLQSGKMSNIESYQIQQAKISARQRMEKVIEKVDQSLMHLGVDKSSSYTNEYSKNLNQIQNLKMAINRHQANQSPTMNGVDITSEEYLRQLLMSVSTEQSLLDQEALMLSYMAKLVALDAQTLEYEMAYGDEQGAEMISEASKPSTATTLFYQE